ncbi:TPA: hypothetical protein KOT29_001234 [Clostridioides difficile]|nr:hypothetical protein [Clostridioides difficile]
MKKISQEKISTHIQEIPQEKIEQWKSLYEKYKSILKVNYICLFDYLFISS